MHGPPESFQAGSVLGGAARPMREDAQILARERECRDCGLFQILPVLAPGEAACCGRCNATLRRGRRDSLNRTLACAVGALLLFIVALQLPFLNVQAVGRSYQATLFTGPTMLDARGMWEISIVVVMTLIIMPAVQFVLLLSVLLGLRLRRPPRVLPRLFGYLERIRPWSMIEVFLLGVFVAYTRLRAIATVDVGPGLFALAGVMLCLIAADAELDDEQVWDQLESHGLLHFREPPPTDRRIGCDCCRLVLYAPSGWPCPRCGRRLRHRKRQSILRAWSLLFAATVLYLPANLFPIITVIRFGQGEPSTIMQGVIELIQAQMWPLAALVFLASITVPMLKLVSLTAMLLTTHDGSFYRLRDRTRLYRLIESVGRWSMIDVFMLTVLVALVHMGFIATVLPGPGAICFASVVVLTMFATASFDPRLMWDAAAAHGHDVETGHKPDTASEQRA
jgi:paraquat-inducible protein A